jgi:hypothetical protein
VPEQHSPDGSPADSVAAESAAVDWAAVDWVELRLAELRSAEADSVAAGSWEHSAAAERYFREHSPDDYFLDGCFRGECSAASADSVVPPGLPLLGPDCPQAAHFPGALPAYSVPDDPYSAWQVSPEAQPSPPDAPPPPDAAWQLHSLPAAVPDAPPVPAAVWRTIPAEAEAFALPPPAGS